MKKGDDQMAGADKCTQGPAHWCASKENANACGSGVIFCTKSILNYRFACSSGMKIKSIMS